MNILIFKTNINSAGEFNFVKTHLAKKRGVFECTIDLDDRDKILRVISEKLTVKQVERKVALLGFYCRELED